MRISRKFKRALEAELRRLIERELTTAEKNQLAAAQKTLKMPDAMVAVMGQMTKDEAREIIFKLTGKRPREAREATGTEPMTPDERRDAYSNLRVTLNGKPADISGFRNRFATVWARGVGSAEWSWDAVERIVKAGGRFKAEIF